MKTIKPFRYVEELDCFVATREWQSIIQRLGLSEWSSVVFMGRFFARDNDFGEHWFDNWDERDELSAKAEKLGIEDELLIIVPQRFAEGNDDGTVHLPLNIRKGFNLTEVEAMSTGSESETTRMLSGDIVTFAKAMKPDGPCHSPGLRKAFWTAVLKSLELPYDFLFAAAVETSKRYPEDGFEGYKLEQEIEKIKAEIAT